MSKHTPGPWQWTQHFDPTISIYKDGFGQIARLYDSSAGTGKANARLIAAAPDLLEALVWMVENDDTNEGDTPIEKFGGASWNEVNAHWIAGLNKARAAIAKATGGAA